MLCHTVLWIFIRQITRTKKYGDRKNAEMLIFQFVSRKFVRRWDRLTSPVNEPKNSSWRHTTRLICSFFVIQRSKSYLLLTKTMCAFPIWLGSFADLEETHAFFCDFQLPANRQIPNEIIICIARKNGKCCVGIWTHVHISFGLPLDILVEENFLHLFLPFVAVPADFDEIIGFQATKTICPAWH